MRDADSDPGNLPLPNPVDRRSFLSRAATTAGLLALGPGALSDALRPGEHPHSAPGRTGADLEELSLSELSEGLATGRWTSRSLVEGYLERIEAIDRSGPTIHAILELNPEALEIAAALDAERAASGPRSRLHGIPVLVKDVFGTADKMHTSAGSLALEHHIAPKDAAVIERLRKAGCVILGKTNPSEWGNARGRASIAGWSARGGLTVNPYALDRSAGGSSSGSAAAISASLAAAAVGSETMGSVVTPASICGIVGLKPTVGLVSRSGTIPISLTQDTPGPMGRSVRDVAMLLSVIAGTDPADPATGAAEGKVEPDYTRFLDPNGLKGARIGVARNLFGNSIVADRVCNRALALMRSEGAVIVDPANIETAGAIWTFDSEVLVFELKAALDRYLGALDKTSPVRSLADVIAFNDRNRDRELKWFGQETFIYAQTKGPLTSPEYLQALAMVRQLARIQGLDATFDKHRLDALVAPTQSPAWLIDLMLGDNTIMGSWVAPAAAGYPSLSVPAGDVAGLPVGMLFMGRPWGEGTLIRLAFAFEQLIQARRPPTYIPSSPTLAPAPRNRPGIQR